MTSAISFHAGSTIQNLSGSGLGFFGSGFGTSVAVGAYQDTTWITDSAGALQGPQATNVKFTHSASGSINGAATLNLLNVPNSLATLNIRMTNDVACTTQAGLVYIYDRVSTSNAPSGIVCKVATIEHPNDNLQTGLTGSGSSAWSSLSGSGVVLSVVSSPGVSGLRGNGASTSSVQHDWYLAISPSPSVIGAKTFALFFETEYL